MVAVGLSLRCVCVFACGWVGGLRVVRGFVGVRVGGRGCGCVCGCVGGCVGVWVGVGVGSGAGAVCSRVVRFVCVCRFVAGGGWVESVNAELRERD